MGVDSLWLMALAVALENWTRRSAFLRPRNTGSLALPQKSAILNEVKDLTVSTACDH